MSLFLSVIFICAGTVLAAGINPKQAVPPLALESLRIINQLDGWHEVKKDGFIPFNAEKLFDLINGGATEYIEQGLIRGFFQRLAGPGGCAVDIYVEDFSTPRKAETMLQVKLEGLDSTASLPGFDIGNIIVSPAIGAQVAYGALGRFYFEATITGGKEKALTMLQRLFLFYDTIIHANMKDEVNKQFSR